MAVFTVSLNNDAVIKTWFFVLRDQKLIERLFDTFLVIASHKCLKRQVHQQPMRGSAVIVISGAILAAKNILELRRCGMICKMLLYFLRAMEGVARSGFGQIERSNLLRLCAQKFQQLWPSWVVQGRAQASPWSQVTSHVRSFFAKLRTATKQTPDGSGSAIRTGTRINFNPSSSATSSTRLWQKAASPRKSPTATSLCNQSNTTFQSQSGSHRVRLPHADGSPPNIMLTRQVIQ